MNKKYIAPAVEVYNVNNSTILEGSGTIIDDGVNQIVGGQITSSDNIASKLSEAFEDVDE